MDAPAAEGWIATSLCPRLGDAPFYLMVARDERAHPTGPTRRRGGRRCENGETAWQMGAHSVYLADDGIDDAEMDAGDEAAQIAAAQRDPAAFGVLYRRYLPRVYRYLRAHTPSAEDAADLTQQVFLRALDALSGYRVTGAPFAAWLFRIARHAAIDAARARRPLLDAGALPEGLHPVDPRGPEGEAIRRESLDQLATLLRGLDPAKRELLTLRFAGGLSATEIAGVVGKRPEAVKRQLTRILQALKEQYRDA